MLTLTFIASLMLVISRVSGHGLISNIKGANGKTVNGFGVKNINRGEVTVFGGRAGCPGRNIAQDLAAAKANGLPTVNGDGSINAVYHQFNGGRDGAGPLRAFLDTTGTGNNFKEIRVSKNVGDRGAGSAQGFTIVVPPSTSCANGVCLLKAANPAGPFGSCFAVAPPKGGAAAPVANNNNKAPASGNKVNQNLAQPNKAAQPAQDKTRKRKGRKHRGKKHRKNKGGKRQVYEDEDQY